MKVILISQINSLGNVGDVVTVKDGYAKNFLVPKKKAICYTASNYKYFETKKKEFEAANDQNQKAAGELKQKLNGKDLIVIENASDDGRLYGAVNTSIIAGKVNEIIGDKSVSRSQIILEKPIKDVGVYTILVDLHSNTNVELRLVVARAESDVQNVIEADAAKKAKAKQDEGKEKEESEKIAKAKEETAEVEATEESEDSSKAESKKDVAEKEATAQ